MLLSTDLSLYSVANTPAPAVRVGSFVPAVMYHLLVKYENMARGSERL